MNGYYLSMLIVLAVVRPAIGLLHELGHAGMATLLVRKNLIRIYLGSYGDRKRRKHVRIGRYELWFQWRFLLLPFGLVDYNGEKAVSWQRHLWIQMAGAGMSFTVVGGAVVLVLGAENGPVRFVAALTGFLALV
ncbi:MAG: hypothetical protein AAF570_11315, partial [Bacteroidota bacterium]